MREEDSLPVLLLLTCCVDPKGMAYTVINDRNTRIKQYYEAFDFYLENTSYKILIVENTLFDIDEKYLNNDRVEYLTFNGNDFNKELGKGYGEVLIIEHALNNSKFLKENKDSYIIKITGRLSALNINKLIDSLPDNNKGYVSANITWDRNFAYSHFFISNFKFLKYFVEKKDLINDSNGIYFENLLSHAIKEMNKNGFYFLPLLEPTRIKGVSGSTGNRYVDDFSILDLIIFKIKNFYFKYFL